MGQCRAPRAETTGTILIVGLRLGERPRVIATTTPRAVPLIETAPG